MTDFLSQLPKIVQSNRAVKKEQFDVCLASYSLISSRSCRLNNGPKRQFGSEKRIPSYGLRKSWLPRVLEDFGNGGAFPEIHVAQFPLDMGRGETSERTAIVALQTSDDGKLEYDAVVKQGLNDRAAIYTRPVALKPCWTPVETLRKNKEDAQEVEQRTRQALSLKLARKMSRGLNKSVNQKPEYIRYTTSDQGAIHNADCNQRIIRMVEAQVDPLEPPKFQHKRMPRGPPSPPPAILHSPPRKLSASDQASWTIPPCISNWKNQKGYTIPLDKRLQADGRNLQEISVNDKFASLSESLYIAERVAREEIRLRNDLMKQKRQEEELAREEQLRELANKAREERTSFVQNKKKNLVVTDNQGQAVCKRQEIEEQQRKEYERELRLQRAGKRAKYSRDEGRDISEKVALGQAKPTTQATLFDNRLFNQSAGLDTGFEGGDDEKYNVYDKPLFVDRTKDILYRYDQERMAQNLGSKASLPAFSGADSSKKRIAPVEFEGDTTDPFGLDTLIDAANARRQGKNEKKTES